MIEKLWSGIPPKRSEGEGVIVAEHQAAVAEVQLVNREARPIRLLIAFTHLSAGPLSGVIIEALPLSKADSCAQGHARKRIGHDSNGSSSLVIGHGLNHSSCTVSRVASDLPKSLISKVPVFSFSKQLGARIDDNLALMVVRFMKPVTAPNIRNPTPALAAFKSKPLAAAIGGALAQWKPQASAPTKTLVAQFTHGTHELQVHGKLLTGTIRFGRRILHLRADIAQKGQTLELSDLSLRPLFTQAKPVFDSPPTARLGVLRGLFVKGDAGFKHMAECRQLLAAFAAMNGFKHVRLTGDHGGINETTANPGRKSNRVIDAQTGKHVLTPKTKPAP